MADNVIQLRTSAQAPNNVGSEPSGNSPQEKPIPPQVVAFHQAEQNRRDGFKDLQEKVTSLETKKRGTANHPGTEARLRDLETGLAAASKTINGINVVLDLIKHDLIATIQSSEALLQEGFRSSVLADTMLTLLKRQGVLTEENLEATWQEVLAKHREQAKKNAEARNAPPASAPVETQPV